MLTLQELFKDFKNTEELEKRIPQYCPADYTWVHAAILVAQRAKLIPNPPATVIDLGSGDGKPATLFANHGYTAYGIEIHPELVETARINVATVTKLPNPPQFAQGNYLPKELRPRIKKNWHVLLDDTPDPYKTLEIMLAEIDIFFAYPYPQQVQSIAQLFQQYAKQGAKLLAIGYEAIWNYKIQQPNIKQLAALPTGKTTSFTVYEKI